MKMTDLEQRTARAMLSAQAAYESPPDVDTDDRTSLQPLGPAQVLVCFHFTDSGVVVDGVFVNGEIVDADCFAPKIVERWESAIEREYGSEG